MPPPDSVRLRNHIEALWRFQARSDPWRPVDAIVCLGSYDLRVAAYAADLAIVCPASRLLVTGSYGNWTRGVFDAPEAEVFARVMQERGVPADRILIEPNATNVGENIAFSRDLLGRDTQSAAFVTKPQTQMRVRATIPIHWPGLQASVLAPPLTVEDYQSTQGDLAALPNEMVGDLQRMLAYPELGFQVTTPIPDEILNAFEALKAAGFTEHLLATA